MLRYEHWKQSRVWVSKELEELPQNVDREYDKYHSSEDSIWSSNKYAQLTELLGIWAPHILHTYMTLCIANYFGADEILPVPFRDYFISAMKHLYKDPGTFKKSGFIRIHVIILAFFDRHLSSKNPHGFPPPFEAPSVVEASCKRAMTWGAMKHNHGALVCDQVDRW